MEVIMLTANMDGRRPQDVFNLILAACLFISPWLLGFAGATMPARNAWIVAVVLALVAVAALSAFAEWEEWVNVVLGLWLMAAPWVLGFTDNVYAFWTHLVLGALTATVSAWAVWDYRHEPHSTA
jgi:ABC-type Co2+ transport system permease subunit